MALTSKRKAAIPVHITRAHSGTSVAKARNASPTIVPSINGMKAIILLAATVAEVLSNREPSASLSRKYSLVVSPEKLPVGMRLFMKMQDKYMRNMSQVDT